MDVRAVTIRIGKAVFVRNVELYDIFKNHGNQRGRVALLQFHQSVRYWKSILRQNTFF